MNLRNLVLGWKSAQANTRRNPFQQQGEEEESEAEPEPTASSSTTRPARSLRGSRFGTCDSRHVGVRRPASAQGAPWRPADRLHVVQPRCHDAAPGGRCVGQDTRTQRASSSLAGRASSHADSHDAALCPARSVGYRKAWKSTTQP